ncbi:MAG: cation-translocating P-type ATPase [Cyclobacteriaceae bacterium]|nr:cation-translocating P-type ATPase [Cyclobacteriaceae bacterium]UYN86549.1 MAG: cation-translocating P-type ATPase [Cyclobacteriaceae bacterium]
MSIQDAAVNFNQHGLKSSEVEDSRIRNGKNVQDQKGETGFLIALKALLVEPMFLLLLAASTIYFITGEIGDGIFMVSAIVLVATISLYQESRSRKALSALRTLTRPHCKVIRDGAVMEIRSEEIVLGDIMMVEEGSMIPADGSIVQSNDFFVNESLLTGETFPVQKDEQDNQVYQGTLVTGGLAICRVTAIGNKTRLGKIGKSIEAIEEEDTPLQIQIRNFVKKMAMAGLIVFLIVWAINFTMSHDPLDSLLKALTLAMSILPEEIPVAFATFMALGAWRMMKMGVLAKQTKTVETLGSATVICTDKTGTITENQMKLAKVFVMANQKIAEPPVFDEAAQELVRMGMWASEPIPFDPMEIALHEVYQKHTKEDERPYFRFVHEYPLSGKPPMMTHVFQNEQGQRIIAAKGAPEALLAVSLLSQQEKQVIEEAVRKLSLEGFRVLGVGETHMDGNDFPEQQQHYKFNFKGLLAFYDPPKKNIAGVFDAFYKAGIDVKILTGDNAETTATIARQVNFKGAENSLTGDELVTMDEEELKHKVKDTHVFTRMFPEAKLRILNALKANGEVVAMTGDGVNDGPALKAAHIGIAMGKKGSEIAKQSASLILIDDDLARMVDAVAMGRKIYANLKKAIQYIISIHIPIILTVLMPLVLGWIYPNIFSPVHVIFLELIMGPTCSIIYENEPQEKNTMIQKPRPFTDNFFNWRELSTSIVQGLVITLGILITYQFAVYQGASEATTRTMVFSSLISANVFLTLVNRSFYYSILTTAGYKNNLVPLIIILTLMLSGLILYVPPLTSFFEFERLAVQQILFSITVGFLSVIWFEALKWRKRKKNHTLNLPA